VHFQNKPTATASASQVVVTVPLPAGITLTSVQLTGFGFGSNHVVLPANEQSFTQTLDGKALRGDNVTVTGAVDPTSSKITWTFSAINSNTGGVDFLPTAGFLPPDTTTGAGEGYVTFSARQAAGLATGTKIATSASITFDRNSPISTGTWSNEIDANVPTAAVTALPAKSKPGTLAVHWHGSDGTGSGIASYDVYESTNGGPLTLWKTGTTTTSATFPVTTGNTYGFAVRDTNNVGTAGAVPSGPSATTFASPPPTITTVAPSSGPTTGGTKLTITGSHLTGTDKVLFKSTQATSFQVVSPTKVTAVAPSHVAGKVGLTVETTYGTATATTAFTYVVPAPTLSSVAPSSGATSGGTPLTLTGAHLTGTTQVLVGGEAASNLHVVSPTGITVTTPAHAAGMVPVTVKTSHGTVTKPTAFTYRTPAPPPPPPKTAGYDMVGADGGVFVFSPPGTHGGFFGSLPGLTPPVRVDDVVGMVPTSTDQGYFLVGADGGVFSFGNAPFLGSLPGLKVTPAHPIAGLVATGTDRGYYLVGRDGGVFAFGNAPFLGSLPGHGVHRTDVVGIAATPSGDGYWLVAADGTVYSFGSAQMLGSATGMGSPVTAIAGTPDGSGYWIVTQNGTVRAFGDATNVGTLPSLGISPALPVIGIVRTADTKGYWLIGSDGGIFAIGDAGFVGSLPGLGVQVADVVGAVSTEG
jgi:hypothetical protein